MLGKNMVVNIKNALLVPLHSCCCLLGSRVYRHVAKVTCLACHTTALFHRFGFGSQLLAHAMLGRRSPCHWHVQAAMPKGSPQPVCSHTVRMPVMSCPFNAISFLFWESHCMPSHHIVPPICLNIQFVHINLFTIEWRSRKRSSIITAHQRVIIN